MIINQKPLNKKTIAKMDHDQLLNDMLTRRLLPERMTILPHHIAQNNFLRRVIMVKNFPSSIETQHILSKISKIKNTTFSLRLQPMNEANAVTLINSQINNRQATWSNARKKTDKIDAEKEEQNITDFYVQLQEGKNKIFLTSILIEFYAETEKELLSKQREILNRLNTFKITCEVLTYQQKEGFSSLQPLGKDLFLNSANNIPSNTLANLYPFSFSNRNDENGLFLGETVDGGYFFLDFDLRTEEITTGNYAIVGQSGQGKTWLQKKIISQLIFKGKTVIMLDPDRDYIEMTNTLGGTVINSASGRVKINPFEVRRLMVDETIEKELEAEDPEAFAQRASAFRHQNIFFQHLSWLRDEFSVLFPEITQRQLNALLLLVQDMYAAHGINETSNFDTLTSTDYPIFSDLYHFIETVLGNEDTHYQHISKELLNELLLLLQDTHTGSLGYLLNGHTNIKNDRIMCFDLNDLLTGAASRLQAVIFNIMTYAWNRVALRQEEILFTVDELSLLLNVKNPIIAVYLRDFAKRFRKYGSQLGTATQEFEDISIPELKHITKPIFANTSFKFLFHPDNSSLDVLQDMMKLTDGEISCIAKPRQKHCLAKVGDEKYYIKIGELSYEKELFGKLSNGASK